MQNTRTVVVHARSVDSAVKKAAEQLGVESAAVEYELISQSDAGFLSFLAGRKVEIKAWAQAKVSSSRRQETPHRQNKAKAQRLDDEEVNVQEVNRDPLSESELEHLVSDLKEFCSGVCGFIVNKDLVQVSAQIEGDRLSLDIDDEDVAQQIAKNSRLAESMEHLLRKKPRYLKRELPFRIFVDAKGMRRKRENELVEMARDLSSQVADNQRPVVLNYKSSYDRKIIHMALDKDERVYTKSIGTGANRKLMILPIKDEVASARFQRHND